MLLEARSSVCTHMAVWFISQFSAHAPLMVGRYELLWMLVIVTL